MTAALILGLIQAAAAALSSPGVTNTRVRAIASLVNQGTALASVATTTGDNFVTAMQSLTARIIALHTEGRDDLTDAEQEALDSAIVQAHIEIQSSQSVAPPPDSSANP